jgi:hypothetical protein
VEFVFAQLHFRFPAFGQIARFKLVRNLMFGSVVSAVQDQCCGHEGDFPLGHYSH